MSRPNARRMLRHLAAWMLAGAAGVCSAGPVVLNYAITAAPLQEYFVDDPVVSGTIGFEAASGSWSLMRDEPTTVLTTRMLSGTGPAVVGCCQTDVHDFILDFTVAGLTRQITARVQMREISNNQYQVDLLDTPAAEFDLGAIGTLTLDLISYAFQPQANTPNYPSFTMRATALLGDPAQAVPLPGSLPLMALGLAGVLALRRRT